MTTTTPVEPHTLTAAYERCRQLNARHGRTYYLATMLLAPWKRHHVHALYGFARYADEIVDTFDPGLAVPDRAAKLHAFADRFLLAAKGGGCDHPVLPAVVHTVRAFDLDLGDFRVFIDSMARDLEVDSYKTYDDLLGYMEGSAAAIGTMMLPVLESADPEAAREPARQLGFAFQLTNFIRDVGEDLHRGRVYLPLADLARFGVTRADLARGEDTPGVRDLLAFEVERARAHYRAAEPGIEMLAPSSRPCIRAAYELYGAILGEVERAGYPVLHRRVRVPRGKRAAIFVRHLAAAKASTRAEQRVTVTVPGS